MEGYRSSHQRQLAYILSYLVMSGVASCGKKQEFDTGDELGPAVLGGEGGIRSSGGYSTSSSSGSSGTKTYVTVTKKRLKPLPTFNIVEVTRVVPAADDRASWTIATLPFVPRGTTDTYRLDRMFAYGADTFFDSSSNTSNVTASDGAWPFRFDYSYPQNNYQFKSAHLVVETMRDSSDTEGIFIDGIFSGRPPSGMVNTTTSLITDHVYANVGANTLGSGGNTYYIDWSLAHYKRNQRNFFDLNLVDLVQGTTKTPYDLVRDGEVQAILGDDSPAYTAYLVVKGLTISNGDLQCSSSGPFSFKNTLVHNDGNSIGTAAFTGTIKPLYQAYSNPAGQTATEFYFDTMAPDTPVDQISLTTANLYLPGAKKSAGACPILVVNGIGVGSASCGRNAANTAVVEAWDEVASLSSAWTTFVASLSTNPANLSIDLKALFGSSKVVTLLKQGKFNVALAGGVVASSINASSTQTAASARTYGVYVDGPELVINGSYTVDTCNVADDSDSPMTEAGFIDPASLVPEYEEYQEVVEVGSAASTTSETGGTSDVLNDGSAPVIASLQVQDITSTSAVILWTTDEPSTSIVKYGVTSPDTTAPEITSLSTFHKVTLTGLSPYKYYKYQVYSADQYGNLSSSNITVFTTLR